MILVSWTPLHHMIPSLLSFMCFFCCISKKMISNLFKSYLMFDNLFRCFSSNSCMTSMMKKADGLSESDGMLTTATFCYWNISELNNMLIYVDSVCFFVFFFFLFQFFDWCNFVMAINELVLCQLGLTKDLFARPSEQAWEAYCMVHSAHLSYLKWDTLASMPSAMMNCWIRNY